ncbi:MAG: protein phosphatase [Planctomycetota bacterium]|nr:MAG: protein phosphatase [Planctomycetota bacterium]
MRVIIDQLLWIGNAGDARDLRSIHDDGIRAVVDLAADEPPAVLSRGLVYYRFPLLDGDGNPPWLLRSVIDCVATVISHQVPLLVACSGGMSRSPVVIAAALAIAYGKPIDECLKQVVGDGPQQVSAALWNAAAAAIENGESTVPPV